MSELTAQELLKVTKDILEKMARNGNYAGIEKYLDGVIQQKNGFYVLTRLAAKSGGLDVFLREQIKLNMPDVWWEMVEKKTCQTVDKFGGRKSRRR